MANEGSCISLTALIDALADEFETALKRGGRPKIAQALAEAPPESRVRLLAELVKVEFEHRWKVGEQPRIADYLGAFPDLADSESASVQWRAFEARVRQRYQGCPTAEEATVDRPRPSATRDDAPQRIGRYPVIRRLASEGQGDVFLGTHPLLGTQVAIKTCRRDRGASNGARLSQEAHILAGLDHPNIARVFDLDLHEGEPFLAMEYVRGRTLEQYASDAALSHYRIASIMGQIAQALAAAHRAGVLHLDLKPRNVLIDHEDRVRVIDFGLAGMRDAYRESTGEPGSISGSVPYMSPEQANGRPEDIDARSDVFGMGGVLYFLLTGRPLYRAQSRAELIRSARRCAYDVTLLDRAPAGLRRVCLKALACDRRQRYPSAEALAADLQRFIRAPRRRLVLASSAAAIAAAATVMLAVAFLRPSQPDHARLEPLEVLVHDQDDGLTWRLDDGNLPLSQRHQVRIVGTVPDGYFGTLVAYEKVERDEYPFRILGRVRPEDPVRKISYPAADGFAPLGAGPGTEVLLLFASRSAAVELNDLWRRWPDHNQWPLLPENTTASLDPDQVSIRVSNPGAGSSSGTKTIGARDAVELLDLVRQTVVDAPGVAGVTGVAFSHVPSSAEQPPGHGDR